LKRAEGTDSAAHFESADEIKKDIQLPALQGQAHLRSAQPRAPELLRETAMPEGVEGREPEAMDGEAGERKLLSRGR